jgi:hypothetical protein
LRREFWRNAFSRSEDEFLSVILEIEQTDRIGRGIGAGSQSERQQSSGEQQFFHGGSFLDPKTAPHGLGSLLDPRMSVSSSD